MPTLRIREAITDDAATVAGVHVRSHQWAYRGQLPDNLLDGMSLEMEQRAARWRKIIDRPRTSGVTWLAELDGRPIGIASAGPSRDADAPPDTGELYSIHVAEEEFTRHGVGTLLFVEVCNLLRSELDYSLLTLWVVDTNVLAQRFYESAGFRPDGSTQQGEESGATWTELRYQMAL